MSTLGGDDVRAWRLRVPQLAIAWGLPLTIVIVGILTWDQSSDETIQDTLSWQESVYLMLSCTAFLAAVFAWTRPRSALWVFAVCCFAQGIVPGGSDDEFLVGLPWMAVAAADAVLARRQHSLSRDWTQREHHPLDTRPILAQDRRAPTATRVLSGMSFALAVAIVALWVSALGELAELDERAVSRDVEVIELDTTFDFVDYRLDGREYETQVWDATDYQVGEEMTVRVDPAGQFDPLGPEDSDPQGTTFWGPLCAPLLLLAAMLWLTPLRRRRDRERAYTDVRPVWAKVKPARADGGLVLMADDGTPFAFSRKASTHYALSPIEGQPPPPGVARPDNVYPVRVYGLTRFGRTALVEIPDLGILLVPKAPLRDPFTVRAGVARATSRSRHA